MTATLQRLLEEGLADGVFPSARAAVLLDGKPAFQGAAGPHSTFDLASLTKVMSTTAAFLSLWSKGLVTPDAPVARFFPHAALGRAGATLADLLFHRSGAPAFVPFFARVMPAFPRLFDEACPALLRDEARREVLRLALATGPIHPAGTAVYSDVGFILLGEVLSRAAALPSDTLFTELVARPLGLCARFRRLSASPPAAPEIAPTGSGRPREPAPGQEGMWKLSPGPGRPGEVEDDNAWSMDGVAGHAGLFSTAEDVAAFGQAVLDGLAGESPLAPRALWEEAARRDERTPGSTRALGFDTPSAEGSSAGRHFSPRSVGHLGFTGTSLWVDLSRRLVVALLTNRVHSGRGNLRIRDFRPRFHDAVIEALGLS